jgi:hypothetical protein
LKLSRASVVTITGFTNIFEPTMGSKCLGLLKELAQLGLAGMARAFGEIEASGEAATLTHPEWLALLLDQEASYRVERRLHARLRYARLRHQAAVEGRLPRRARTRSCASKSLRPNRSTSGGGIAANEEADFRRSRRRQWPAVASVRV